MVDISKVIRGLPRMGDVKTHENICRELYSMVPGKAVRPKSEPGFATGAFELIDCHGGGIGLSFRTEADAREWGIYLFVNERIANRVRHAT